MPVNELLDWHSRAVDRTEFMQDGKAQKIEFTLTLKKQSEDIREGLGSITAGDVLSMINV